VKSNKPLGFVSLDYFIKSTKNPKPHIINVFDNIYQAEISGNNELKSELKQNNLFYFTPCVIVDEFRRYVNITAFTGLLVLDFDHISDASEFKKYLYDTYPFIICAYLSPSKMGVKCLVKIPVCKNINEFKAYFFGLQVEMKQYRGYDSATQNAVLPLFQSIDKELLYRDNAATWDIKGKNPRAIEKNPLKKYCTPLYSDIKKNRVIKIIESSINKISNNGHPQLRSACIAAGGYIASRYIDYYEAENIIFSLIECNSYLQKGISGYKKTAKWAINEGMKNPIILQK
jgi:hypothetical protein